MRTLLSAHGHVTAGEAGQAAAHGGDRIRPSSFLVAVERSDSRVHPRDGATSSRGSYQEVIEQATITRR